MVNTIRNLITESDDFFESLRSQKSYQSGNQIGDYDIIDIKNKIPDELKAVINHYKVSAVLKSIYTNHWATREIANKKSENFLLSLKKKLLEEIGEEFKYKGGFGGPLYGESLHNLFNDLSEGAYLDNTKINHVVYAYDERGSKNHEMLLEIVGEEDKTIVEKEYSGDFFFSAGKNHFLNPTSELIIYDVHNPKYKERMEKLWEENKKRYFKNDNSFVNKILKVAECKDDKNKKIYDVTLPCDHNLMMLQKAQEIQVVENIPYLEGISIGIIRKLKGKLLPFCVLKELPMDTHRDIGGIEDGDYWFNVADTVIDLRNNRMFKYKVKN